MSEVTYGFSNVRLPTFDASSLNEATLGIGQFEQDQIGEIGVTDAPANLFRPAVMPVNTTQPAPVARPAVMPISTSPPVTASPTLSNDGQAKVDAANYNRTMETMQQISMENSMRQMRYQTQQAMMSGEVTMNAHLANAHITNIDTLGKIMNKGYNKANSAIQSQ